MKQCISIANLNKRHNRTKPFSGSIPYPLYQSYKENYNFDNIKDSVEKWASYSKDTNKSLTRVLELFDIVLEQGTECQLATITNRINENIIFSLDNPSLLKHTMLMKIKENTKPYIESILKAIDESTQCDRIIANHKDKFSKRFNIDSYVRENANGDNVRETIYELCSFIDTYNMGVNSKYSIALEEVLFSFYKNNKSIANTAIVENVTDYFLSNYIKEEDSSKELLLILGETANRNRFFSNNDTKYISELSNILEESVKEETLDSILEFSLKDKTKEMIDKFKTLPSKSPEALKQLLINILVVNKDSNIIDGSKNLLSIAFYFLCIVGVASVGMYAGIFAAVVAKTVNMIYERKYMTDVLKVWYRDRDSVTRKIDKCKDAKKKEKLEAYLKQLDKSIDTLESHSDSLRGDDEKKSWETRPARKGDDEFNFDFNFDEDAKSLASDIFVVESAVSSISWNKEFNEATLFATDTILNMQLEDVDFLTDFCVKYPHMINRDKMLEALEFADRVASKEGIIKYNKINCYAENINKLNSLEFDGISDDMFDDENDVFNNMNELYEQTKTINTYVKAIHELSITSNLKLAMDKVSNVVSGFSDKEKIMSRSVDAACTMLSRSVEKAMTMENREAVIRGDILPSASKVIKLAIVTVGAAWLIHPALAIIMLLGRFAMSAKIRTKERQLILDELDVELAMIDKYITMAEEKKDMKRIKELLIIKKKLQAQDARLRYKIKVEWNDQNVKALGDKEEKD